LGNLLLRLDEAVIAYPDENGRDQTVITIACDSKLKYLSTDL
jgi:hypothetical protein